MSMDISGPALAPPAGQTSHFDNPPNNNSLGLGAFLLMLAIASLFFCIRAYGKLYVIRRVEVEDGKLFWMKALETLRSWRISHVYSTWIPSSLACCKSPGRLTIILRSK